MTATPIIIYFWLVRKQTNMWCNDFDIDAKRMMLSNYTEKNALKTYHFDGFLLYRLVEVFVNWVWRFRTCASQFSMQSFSANLRIQNHLGTVIETGFRWTLPCLLLLVEHISSIIVHILQKKDKSVLLSSFQKILVLCSRLQALNEEFRKHGRSYAALVKGSSS